ncbi:hypothetical protein HHK36_022635 [Tetracentron sinense]|uniref:Uncharacterized protein n=1 Tax=Tetracentron sinense TaxID=13715 RepID=A0A835D6I3_TETSI|nr:hypothetical protein HHK36_022635 [Tetracentron sinense]
MNGRLHEATLQGSITSLIELLREDELILDRVNLACIAETPLHIAAMLGHVDFARKILDEPILDKFSVACVTETLLHRAVVLGHIDFAREILSCKLELAYGDQTIPHLCVKYNHMETLRILVDPMGGDKFVNWKDDYGNTILHLAIADKLIEILCDGMHAIYCKKNPTSKIQMVFFLTWMRLDAMHLDNHPTQRKVSRNTRSKRNMIMSMIDIPDKDTYELTIGKVYALAIYQNFISYHGVRTPTKGEGVEESISVLPIEPTDSIESQIEELSVPMEKCFLNEQPLEPSETFYDLNDDDILAWYLLSKVHLILEFGVSSAKGAFTQ